MGARLAEEPVLVYIDRVPFRGGFPAKQVVRNVRISWGPDSVYEPIPPAALTLELIDAYGQLVSDRQIIGKSVEVWLGEQRRIFRGHIDDMSFRFAPVVFENRRYEAWGVTLKAHDMLAELDKFTPIGQGAKNVGKIAKQSLDSIYGPGWWENGVMTNNELLGYIIDVLPPNMPTIGTGTGGTPVYPRIAFGQSGPSALELMNMIWRMPYIQHASYNPGADFVGRQGIGNVTEGASLVIVSGQIRIAEPSVGLSIPADRVIFDPSESVRLPALTQITHIVANGAVGQQGSWEDPHTGDKDAQQDWTGEYKHTVPVPGATSTTENNFTLDLPCYPLDPGVFSGSTETTNAVAWNKQNLDYTAQMIAHMNGRGAPSTLTFNFGLFPTTGDARADELLLNPARDQNNPLYFPGSIFNRFENIGPLFTLIGGELTYEADGTKAITEYVEPAQPAEIHPGSFNIRLASFTEPEPDRDWTVRKPRAASSVIDSGCDIVGLQEVSWVTDPVNSQAQQLCDTINAQLTAPDRWQCVGATGGSNAIIWDSTVFEILGPPTTIDANRVHVIGAYRSAVWAPFRHKASGLVIAFMNTHWQHNDPDAANGDLRRRESARIVADYISSELTDGYDGVVLTGDFNDTAQDSSAPRYSLELAGLQSVQKVARSIENGQLNSHNNWDPTMNNKVEGRWMDGIYVSQSLGVKAAGLNAHFANGSTLPLATPLPSDHIMLKSTVAVLDPVITDPEADNYHWTVDMRTAPVDFDADLVTYADWVTSSTATYADFDPAIRYADLGAVTVGAS